jgi:FAD/FMN-containing dehydrogenase
MMYPDSYQKPNGHPCNMESHGSVEDDDGYQGPFHGVSPRSRWPLMTTVLSIIGLTTIFYFLGRLSNGHSSRVADANVNVRNHQIFQALQQLQKDLDGSIYFRNDDQTFDEACHVYYASAVQDDQAPYAVIEVANEADVQKAVVVLSHLKSTYDFPFRIRSGGHNKAGYSTVANGAVLSLKRMNRLSVVFDHNNKSGDDSVAMARMQPAVLVQQFLSEVLAKYGYAGVVGYCPTVAEGGFILGGGLGLQSRLYGLGLDNVLGMRIVLADGSVHYVSQENQNDMDVDLYWALRGAGGGSFGIVTELEYRIHKASDRVVYASLVLEAASEMANFLYKLGQNERTIPGNLMVMHDQVDTVGLMWSGQNDSEIDLAANYIGGLVEDFVPPHTPHEFHLTELLWTKAVVSKNQPWGVDVYAVRCWYGFLHPVNNTQAVWNDIMSHITRGVHNSSGLLLPDIEFWGGAIYNTPSNATAFPHRSTVFNVGVLLTVPSDTPNAAFAFETEEAKINEWWPNVARYLTGSYVNYPTTTLLQGDYAHAHWGDNLPRLVNIKRRVDPENIFEFPMSVPIEMTT